MGKIEKLWDEFAELKKQEDKEYEIIRCMDSIIQLDPKDVDAWHNKGFALGLLGILEEDAIECFDKVIELDPKYVDAWYNKGFALSELGKHKEAKECFDKENEILES